MLFSVCARGILTVPAVSEASKLRPFHRFYLLVDLNNKWQWAQSKDNFFLYLTKSVSLAIYFFVYVCFPAHLLPSILPNLCARPILMVDISSLHYIYDHYIIVTRDFNVITSR